VSPVETPAAQFSARQTLARIAASWLSIKRWVKAWLFLLNAIFLFALAFWDTAIARWILAAYAASGPLLAVLMWRQRGLTRFLGVAHLIPWLPLLIYLLLRLTTELAGAQISVATSPALAAYLWVLVVAITLCLLWDAYDVVRYLRGQRFVLGSAAAAAAGASSRTLRSPSAHDA